MVSNARGWIASTVLLRGKGKSLFMQLGVRFVTISEGLTTRESTVLVMAKHS